MSTVVLENQGSVAAEIISVLSAGVIVAPPKNLFLEISVPSLGDGHFRLELTDLDDSEIEEGRLVLKARIDTNTRIIVTLLGESATDGFQTNSISVRFENSERTAESNFRGATLRAALSLAAQTRLALPGLNLDLWFRLNEPLREISEMLKLRQTMYRLMVIERATRRHFEIPSFISGEDMKAISPLYHAITERTFGWPLESVQTVNYAASKDVADSLEEWNQSSSFASPSFQHQSLFGIEVPLGEGTITIIDNHIENFEQVVNELRSDDGHPVAVRIRSRIGLAHYNFPDAPRLPENAWNADLQMLIDMDEQLDAALMERYNALAAATLEGLTDEQKAEITARPEIGEAFLIDDASMEKI
jgi:hypothetical protein